MRLAISGHAPCAEDVSQLIQLLLSEGMLGWLALGSHLILPPGMTQKALRPVTGSVRGGVGG